MYHHVDLLCKVCGGICCKEDWDAKRSCRSCIEFYDRSTEKMNSSKSFSYHCTCMENCYAKGSIQCNWNSGKWNHCKQCRFVKYQTTWIRWWFEYISSSFWFFYRPLSKIVWCIWGKTIIYLWNVKTIIKMYI